MARVPRKPEMTLSELQVIVNQKRRQLSRLHRKRETLAQRLAALDTEIAEVEGAGRGGTRARNEQSLVDVIHAVLEKHGEPMQVTDLTRAVQGTGYKSNAADFRAIVNQALIKERKRFNQVARGVYGLKKG